MKKLTFAVFLLSAFNALACQEESQFIARIGSTKIENGKCIIGVSNFSMYNVSGVCPLWESDVIEAGITTEFGPETCGKLVGSEISGYLVRPEGSSQIFLD